MSQPQVIYVQGPPPRKDYTALYLLGIVGSVVLMPFLCCGGCMMLTAFSAATSRGVGSPDDPDGRTTEKAQPSRVPFTDEEKLAIIGFIQPYHGVDDMQPGNPNKLYVTILFQQLPATEKERVCDALTRAALNIREDEPRTSEGMFYIYDNRDRKYIGQYDRARGIRMK